LNSTIHRSQSSSVRSTLSKLMSDCFPLRAALFGLSILIAVSWSCLGLSRRLPYPTRTDQDSYLLAGMEFLEHFTLMQRAPVYSAWVGVCYAVSDHDLHRTLLVEKIASVALLAALTGLLAWRLFGLSAGILLGCWTANCRYLLLETNGSHTLAASLYLAAMLCLSMPWRSACLPSALLLTYLSTQARSEMWVPLLAITAALIIRFVKEGLCRIDACSWVTCSVVWFTLASLFAVRSSWPEPNRLASAFVQNYAVGYVERHNLFDRFPDPWSSSAAIWSEALPGASSPGTAALRYPQEVGRHLLHNLRIIPRSLLALTFRIDRTPVLIAGLVAWVLLALRSRDRRPGNLPANARRDLLLWGAAVWLLVPISLIFRVAARYYIQLLPSTLLGSYALACGFARMMAEKIGPSTESDPPASY
jgi:hypothetical protein